jgi:hypothetical protein
MSNNEVKSEGDGGGCCLLIIIVAALWFFFPSSCGNEKRIENLEKRVELLDQRILNLENKESGKAPWLEKEPTPETK